MPRTKPETRKPAAPKAPKAAKNPFLDTVSIRKWKPDQGMLSSIDETLRRGSGQGHEPDQWHKDYANAGR